MVDFDYFRDLIIAFLTFVGAGLGLPLPEEVLIVGAGIWTVNHQEQYGLFVWLMLPVCIVGVLLADVLLYSIGRFFGPRLLKRRWIQKMIPPDKLVRIEQNYHQYGVGILLFGRLVPGIRVPLFLTAGIMRLSIPRFILADGLGAVLGNSLLYFLAFWFGDSVMYFVRTTEEKVSHSKPIIIIVCIALIGAYLLYRFLRKPVPEGDIEKEVPIIGHQIAVHMHSEDTKVKTEPQTTPPVVESGPDGVVVNTEQRVKE